MKSLSYRNVRNKLGAQYEQSLQILAFRKLQRHRMIGGRAVALDDLRLDARSVRRWLKASACTNSTFGPSSALAARFSRATSSEGAELSTAVTRAAPPASALMAKPPV